MPSDRIASVAPFRSTLSGASPSRQLSNTTAFLRTNLPAVRYSLDMPLLSRTLAILTLSMSVGLCSSQTSSKSMSFSSEDNKVADFVRLPESVLVALTNDKQDFPDGMSQNLQRERHEQVGDEPRPEILCRRLSLSSEPGENYLIIGVGGLRGAHIVPFWLFHRSHDTVSLLLKTRSDQIDILPKQFNGYAEVRSTWIQRAGTTIITDSFRFNGEKYVRHNRQTQHH